MAFWAVKIKFPWTSSRAIPWTSGREENHSSPRPQLHSALLFFMNHYWKVNSNPHVMLHHVFTSYFELAALCVLYIVMDFNVLQAFLGFKWSIQRIFKLNFKDFMTVNMKNFPGNQGLAVFLFFLHKKMVRLN